MTPADLNFAQSCVRALNIIAQAAKEWLRQKTEELKPKDTQQ